MAYKITYKIARTFPGLVGGVGNSGKPGNFIFLSKFISSGALSLKIKYVLASNYAWNDPVSKGVEP